MDVPFLSLKDVTQQHAAEIHEAVNRVVDSGWYLQGKENSAFEAAYASYIGTRHAIGVANGLDALELIFRAYIEMDIMAPGDEVIVPSFTFLATALAAIHTNAVPVFVDIEPRRADLARYGLTVAQVQDVIMSAIGGENITTTIEGRERYAVNLRYPRELREDLDRLGRVLVPTGMGAQVPIAQLADVSADNIANWRTGAVQELKPQTLRAVKESLARRLALLREARRSALRGATDAVAYVAPR